MNLQQIHATLLSLRKPENRFPKQGICANLEECYHSNHVVKAMSDSWPKASAQPYFPVGGRVEFYGSKDLWANPKRIELLEHCIKLTSSAEVFPFAELRKILTNEHYSADYINQFINEMRGV